MNFKVKKMFSDSKHLILLFNSFLYSFAYMFFLHKKAVDDQLVSLKNVLLVTIMTLCMFAILMIACSTSTKNKIENYIQKVATHPLTTALGIVAIFRVWYSAQLRSFILYYDTKTYTLFDHNILVGETDIFRTPGYPYFIKLISFFSGATLDGTSAEVRFYSAIVFVQSILSFASVILFYLAGRKIFKNRYILTLAATVYGVAPSVVNWDSCILTESVSLFLTVLLIFLIFSYLDKPKLYKAIILPLYCFLMIMFRPSFIYLLAVIGVFFIARLIFCAKDRKKAVCGLVSSALSVILLLSYCGLNYKNYGYFSISSVSTCVNKLYIVISRGMYVNKDYPEITAHIRTELEKEPENVISDVIEPLPEFFAYKDIANYTNDCIEKHSHSYKIYTKEKIENVLDDDVACVYAKPAQENERFEEISMLLTRLTFPFTFESCLYIVAVALIIALIAFIFKKRICWHIIGLCAIIFSQIVVSVFGSMAEFSRLTITIIPATIMLCFYLVDLILSPKIEFNIGLNLDDNNSTKINTKK